MTSSRYNYTPKRLLSLSDKDFRTGIANNAFDDSSALFLTAVGINPYIDPYPGSVNSGLLQTYAAPTDITGVTANDTIWAGVSRVVDGSTAYLYLWGAQGHFYKLDLTNDTLSDLRTVSNPANGIASFKVKGGTEYVYYWQKGQIGRYDYTTFTDAWSTGLQSTNYHQPHPFAGAVYYGNLNRIGKIFDSSGTPTDNNDVLDFPNDYVVTSLEDDGTFLVAGITKNQGASLYGAMTKVVFWDAFSPSWNKEWSLYDLSINTIVRYGNGFLGIGDNLYYFDFNTQPTLIRPHVSTPGYGYPNSADRFRDVVLFAGSSSINSYGKFMPNSPAAFFQPFAGMTGSPTFINSQAKSGRVYVGTASAKLYSFPLSTGGATGVSPQTIYFDLNDVFMIDRVDVVFGAPLASGDSFSVDIKPDESTSATTYGSATFAADGPIRRKEMSLTANKVKTDQLSLILNFTAGNPKIKRIDVYGERVSTI